VTLVCSTRAAARGHVSVSALGSLRSCHRFAHNLLLHCCYICRVLTTFYLAFEIAGGVILSNSAHTVDNSRSVWRILFPGQSKLPAALARLPVFSLATCESCVLLVTLGHIVLHSTALVLEMVRGAKVATWLRRFCHSLLLIACVQGLWQPSWGLGCHCIGRLYCTEYHASTC